MIWVTPRSQETDSCIGGNGEEWNPLASGRRSARLIFMAVACCATRSLSIPSKLPASQHQCEASKIVPISFHHG